ncbi:MAG: hypothetical protein Q8J97_13455 [Flavobacteriaceae bacterium]|nr:hypothetical protein [Flavobacteriaceae bacterium]
MKLERNFFKISISEIIFSIFFLVVLNGVVFLISVVIGKTGFFLRDSVWMSQIIFIFLYSVILASINRNGVLKLTEFDDLATLTKQIESLLFKKGYIAIDSKPEDVKYVKRTKLGRFFNYFFRENVDVRISENGVSIFARKHLLDSIGMRLKYGKTNG